MMRSDMPKQIMAYRNGGGLPSLATAPGNFSNGGGISSFVSNAYNKAVDVVKDALGMGSNLNNPPEFVTGNTSGSTSSGNRAEDYRKSRKAKKKKKAKQAAAREAAAAAAAAAEQEAASVDSGIATLDPNAGANDPDIMNSYIENMVAGRDDLSAEQKLEFAQSLANSYGLTDSSGVQSAVDNLSTVALDPTSSLSDAERVDALTSLQTATGTDYSGLINTLNDQMAINTIASTTPGADVIDDIASTTPGPDLTRPPTVVPEAVLYSGSVGYSPIVPSPNIIPGGIMGLPSTTPSTSSPYVFTAYTPGTYNPAVNPLVLPPLG